MLGWNAEEIELVSLSCTSSPLTTSAAHRHHLGWGYWALKALEVVGAGQSSGVIGTAQLLLGREHVTRFAPSIALRIFELDDISSIGRLRGLGESEARSAKAQLGHFFAEPAAPFEAYYC